MAIDDGLALFDDITLGDDSVGEVWSVEGVDGDGGVFQLELVDDVLLYNCGSGCGECHHGGIWEVISEGCELAVFRAEVVSPLRNAVSFIDCDGVYLVTEKEFVEIFL